MGPATNAFRTDDSDLVDQAEMSTTLDLATGVEAGVVPSVDGDELLALLAGEAASEPVAAALWW